MRLVPLEDATAAARIRDAAIVLFGARGFGRTSVREIAAEAGVSPALVIHHYGSKEGLRAACDEWLVRELIGEKSTTQAAKVAVAVRKWLDDPDRFGSYLEYFAMMLADGSDGGRRLFGRLVQETRAMLDAGVADGSIHETSDPELRSVLVTVYGLAPIVMRDQLAQALGLPFGDATSIRRMTIPTLELYTNGLYTDDRMLRTVSAVLEGEASTASALRSDKGRGKPNQDPDPPSGSDIQDPLPHDTEGSP